MENRYDHISTIFIRFTLGFIFFIHGLNKIKGFEETLHHFQVDYGIPYFLTCTVIIIEVVGGSLLLMGICTRIASLGVALIMIGAIYTVTWEKGFINGFEFDLALLAMSLSLLLRKSS